MRTAPVRPRPTNLKPASLNPSRRSRRTRRAARAGPNMPILTRRVNGTPRARRPSQMAQLIPKASTVKRAIPVQFTVEAGLDGFAEGVFVTSVSMHVSFFDGRSFYLHFSISVLAEILTYWYDICQEGRKSCSVTRCTV